MKKRTSNKKLVGKLTALVIAALMLVSVVPMTALAAPTGYQSGDKVLYLPSMSASDPGIVNPYGVTVSAPTANLNMKLDESDPTKLMVTNNPSGAGGAGVGLVTDLPLDTTSQYTIEYYAKLNASTAMIFGLCQNPAYPIEGANLIIPADGSSVCTHSKWWANGWNNANGSRWGKTMNTNVWETRDNAEGFVRFVLTIDKGWITLSIGGTPITTKWNLNSKYNNNFVNMSSFKYKTLCLEAGISDDSGTFAWPAVGACALEVKDISIYSGIVEIAPKEYKDGDLLLELPSLNADKVTGNNFDISIRNTADADGTRDAGDSTKILAKSTATTGGVGLYTNLPLSSDSAYTVEYYAKVTDASKGMGVFLGFTGNQNWVTYGANMYAYATGKTVNMASKYEANCFFKEGSEDDRYGVNTSYNIWDRADENGFVKFVLTFDGRYMTLSVDGSNIGVRYDLTRVESGKHSRGVVPSFDDLTKGTLCIGAGFSSADSTASVAADDCVVQIKDISIYAGVRTEVELRDSTGKTLSKESTFASDGVTVSEFPAIESEKQVVWFNANNGYAASSGITYNRDTVLVAEEKALDFSDIVGVQLGQAESGRQDIRLIGGLYNLEGENVGFDVLIKYKDAEGNIKEDKHRVTGTYVYNSLNATVDGEIKNCTASSLGAYYLFALVIEDIPTGEGVQLDFTVAAFRTVDGQRVYSEISEFSVVNGAVSTTAAPLA